MYRDAMRLRARVGFTLVETIVALVLLEVGMLAMAATAGAAAHDLSDALVRRRAQAIVRSRADWLRPSACVSATAGSRALAGGMIEHWRVDAIGAARAVTDSISVPLTRGRTATVVANAWVLCGP